MLAFLFPGQGSQRVGMCKDYRHLFPEARRVFEEASDILGLDMQRLCFQSTLPELTATENAQPAIFTCSMAVLRVVEGMGIRPQVVAGHSVGEISALVAGGALSFADGLQMTRHRGLLMARVSTPGAMAAVVGLTEEQVDALCAAANKEGAIGLALHNSLKQLVVSGAVPAVERFVELARQAGALKVTPLTVSSAFHSPLMAQVVQEWAAYVESVPLQAPQVPVVLNTTARPTAGVGTIRRALVDQLTMPVRWVQTVQTLKQMGVETAVEVGTSKVLAGFNRDIDRQLQTVSLETPTRLRALRRRSGLGDGRAQRAQKPPVPAYDE